MKIEVINKHIKVYYNVDINEIMVLMYDRIYFPKNEKQYFLVKFVN